MGTCDLCGIVWWSTDHTYKNAITNQLYLAISARGYQITGNQTYLDNANKVRIRTLFQLLRMVKDEC